MVEVAPGAGQLIRRVRHVDTLVLAFLDPCVRALDEGPGGSHELLQEFLGRVVEVREDRVHIVERPLVQGGLRLVEILLGARDVDVGLPEVFDDPLDRDELRGSGLRLVHGRALLVHELLAALGLEGLAQVRGEAQGASPVIFVELVLRFLERCLDLLRRDALGPERGDLPPELLDGGRGLLPEGSLGPVDQALRRRDVPLGSVEIVVLDRRVGARHEGHGLGHVHLLFQETLDFLAERGHPLLERLDPLGPDLRLVLQGGGPRLDAGLGDPLDLVDARLSHVDRVAVAAFRVRGLGLLEHHEDGTVHGNARALRMVDLASCPAEDFRGFAAEPFAHGLEVVLHRIEQAVRVLEPLLLDRDRGVRELALHGHGFLPSLAELHDLVPIDLHTGVEHALHLRVRGTEVLVNEGLEINGLPQGDRGVDLPQELAPHLGVQTTRGVDQDDLEGAFHDPTVVGLAGALGTVPRRSDEPARGGGVACGDRLLQIAQDPLELRTLRSQVLEIFEVQAECGQGVFGPLQEDGLPGRIVGHPGRLPDLGVVADLEGFLRLPQEGLGAAHVHAFASFARDLPLDLPQDAIREGHLPRLPQPVSGLVRQHGDVCIDALAQRLSGVR